MKTHVLTGSESEIAESIMRIDGKIHDVIVFIEEPSKTIPGQPEEDMFAEMEPFMVQAGVADCSREALYTRLEDE